MLKVSEHQSQLTVSVGVPPGIRAVLITALFSHQAKSCLNACVIDSFSCRASDPSTSVEPSLFIARIHLGKGDSGVLLLGRGQGEVEQVCH